MKFTVFSDLQEAQVTTVTQQLREKVSVLELLPFENMLYFLTAGGTATL